MDPTDRNDDRARCVTTQGGIRCADMATHKRRCQRHYQALRRQNPAYRAAERDRKYQARYSLTAAEVDLLMAAHDYTCQLCRRPAEQFRRGLVVDHCHDTGLLRGILCSPCNLAIGHLDRTGLHRAAADYLLRAAMLREVS